MGFPATMSAELISQRAEFIKKVYSFFLASLMVAGLGVSLGPQVPAGMTLFIWLASLAMLVFCYVVRRSEPINIVALFGFTFLSGLSIGPLIHSLDMAGLMPVVYQALGITIGVFVGLTLYVFIAKEDFSWLGAFLFPALIGLLLVSVMSWFWPLSSGAYKIYLGFGTLLFVAYILYDTSMIVTRYPDDEYVTGAIELYLDFINLFLFILRLLLLNDDD